MQFDDVALHEIPPNGQGIAALMALGILCHTPLRDFGPDDPMALHYRIDATKLAFRNMDAYVADSPAMTEITPADLLDAGYLACRATEFRAHAATDFGSGAPLMSVGVMVGPMQAQGRGRHLQMTLRTRFWARTCRPPRTRRARATSGGDRDAVAA